MGAMSGQITADGNSFALSGNEEAPALMIGTRSGGRGLELEGMYEGGAVTNTAAEIEIQPLPAEGAPAADAVISEDGEFYLEADTDNSDGVTGFSVLQRTR